MRIIPREQAKERYLTEEEIQAQTPKGVISHIDGRVTQSDLDFLNKMLLDFMERHGIKEE